MAERELSVENLLLVAYANYRLKNYKNMLKFTEKALTVRETPLAYHYKALAKWGLGDLDGAEEAVNDALGREQNNFHHTFLLGIIQWKSGDMDSAEKNLKKAITYSPNQPVFLVEFATFLIHRGRFEEALDAAYKAKSINAAIPKLKQVIASARQKEFRGGIDEVIYEPQLPFNEKTAIPYIRLGDYYSQYGYYNNAQIEYARALKNDKKSTEAKQGFATATRLMQGGFYTIVNNIANYIRMPYISGSLILVLLLLGFMGWKEPMFKMPAIYIGSGLIILTVLVLYLGLQKKSAGDYERILKEWNIPDIEALMAKLSESEKKKTKKEMEHEALQNRVQGMVKYATFFSVLATIVIFIQMILVNIDTRNMSLDAQDNLSMMKGILLFVMVVCMCLAILFRLRSRHVQNEADREKELQESSPPPQTQS